MTALTPEQLTLESGIDARGGATARLYMLESGCLAGGMACLSVACASPLAFARLRLGEPRPAVATPTGTGWRVRVIHSIPTGMICAFSTPSRRPRGSFARVSPVAQPRCGPFRAAGRAAVSDRGGKGGRPRQLRQLRRGLGVIASQAQRASNPIRSPERNADLSRPGAASSMPAAPPTLASASARTAPPPSRSRGSAWARRRRRGGPRPCRPRSGRGCPSGSAR